MGNQQVSLVATRNFEEKLYALDTSHTVIAYERRIMSGRGRWYITILCANCEEQSEVRWESLKKSVGKCDKCSRLLKNLRDGRTQSRLYGVFNSMFGRCYTKSNAKYERYGARGITVCQEWHIWENFRNWAYANGFVEEQPEEYKDYQAIDRIDPLKGYEPSNCRWVTVSQNSINTKDTRTRKLQRLSREGVQPK